MKSALGWQESYQSRNRQEHRRNEANQRRAGIPLFDQPARDRYLRCREIVLIFAAELAQELFVTGEAIDWNNLRLAGIHPAVDRIERREVGNADHGPVPAVLRVSFQYRRQRSPAQTQ